eukprot:scaffold5108_cov172-Amphora_coffeaeformis.AAC.17
MARFRSSVYVMGSVSPCRMARVAAWNSATPVSQSYRDAMCCSMTRLASFTTVLVQNSVSSKSNDSKPRRLPGYVVPLASACAVGVLPIISSNHNSSHETLETALPKRRALGILLQLSFMFCFSAILVRIKERLAYIAVGVVVGNALE